MDLGNLATPEPRAIMLEKQRPDSGSLCGPEARLLSTLRWVQYGRELALITPTPTRQLQLPLSGCIRP